ncbi:MAG: hypothetical protein OXG27_14495 [Chloroflexi bacterium]|nr:hypothetical protein [Chloroflexota bacterium]
MTVSASDGSQSSETLTLSITVEPAAAVLEVRIAARRASGGRFEFALQERSIEGVWRPCRVRDPVAY